MGMKVLGISGSPIENSNTDRLVNAILDSTGVATEFVKLSRINVRPCYACKKCVPDNVCKAEDDFQALAVKIKRADALVLGAYTPYGQIDGFTKALLERFWSLRHVNNLLKGKVCATVLTGLSPVVLDHVNAALAAEVRDYENMELVGQLVIQGNVPCVTCGRGDDCQMSAVKFLHGPEARTADIDYTRVEDLKAVWEKASQIGGAIGERIQKR